MKKILTIIPIILISLCSCKKIKELTDDNPDLTELEIGFKSSAAMGYCASVAHMVFTQDNLPGNVTITMKNKGEYSGSALIYINVNASNPLPFNKNVGDIVIAALWDESKRAGVMSVMLADIDLLNTSFKFFGIHTIPFIEENDTGDILTVFAEQDIIIGEGQDTILNLSLTRLQFNLELNRATEPPATDVFAAVKQDIWFVKVDQNETYNNVFDDTYKINGGGQIASVINKSGGLSYHALINTSFNYDYCSENPIDGYGFIQNIKAGDHIDIGHITLDFHHQCDGRAYVEAAFGKYLKYFGRHVNLNFN